MAYDYRIAVGNLRLEGAPLQAVFLHQSRKRAALFARLFCRPDDVTPVGGQEVDQIGALKLRNDPRFGFPERIIF